MQKETEDKIEVQQKKRKTLGLPFKDQRPIFLYPPPGQSPIKQEAQVFKEYELTNEDLCFIKKTTQKVEDMEDNPQNYFNFGFSFQDFKTFLQTMYLKRVFRAFIEKRVMEVVQEGKEARKKVVAKEVHINPHDLLKIEKK